MKGSKVISHGFLWTEHTVSPVTLYPKAIVLPLLPVCLLSLFLPWNGSQRNQSSYKSMSLQHALRSAAYWVSLSESTHYVEHLWKPTASFGISVKVEFLWKSVCHDRDALENLTASVWNCYKNFTKQQSLAKPIHSFVVSGKLSSNISPLAYAFYLSFFLYKNVSWYSPKYKL